MRIQSFLWVRFCYFLARALLLLYRFVKGKSLLSSATRTYTALIFVLRLFRFYNITGGFRICCVVLVCVAGYAQGKEQWFGFGVNLSGGYYGYEEPQVMSISGAMYGVSGYVSATHHRFRHRLSASYFSGITRYDGSECSVANPLVCTPLRSGSQDSYYTLEYRFGVLMYEDTDMFIYTGLGLGFWDLHNSISASSGYDREQSYVYLPLFLHAQYAISHDMSLYGVFAYQHLLRGYNTSHFRDLGFDNNLSFTQYRGYGVRIEIGLKRDLHEYGYHGAVAVGVYMQYWHIADSSLDGAYRNGTLIALYHEPRNTTQALGLSVGYEF
ncbi:hypothetical protein [uncultured Helicobacter sp.]|uniref:hypothetical protein n=1 Tax=uncultured Helicobacter sp. TaxID=175537 RepID=UPI00374E5861